MRPLVSIIVPVYNTKEEYLRACIDSLHDQTYKNYEIILVDDGSLPSIALVCDQYAGSDKIFVIHKENAGVTKARIEGFLKSHGQYIAFVDSDDILPPNSLELLLKPLEDHNVDLVAGQYKEIRNGKQISCSTRPQKGLYSRRKIDELLKDNFLFDLKTQIAGMNLFLCTKLIKREFVLDALKKGEKLWHGEDMVAVLQLCYNISSMYVIDEPVYIYRRYSEQVTQKYRPDMWDNHVRCWKTLQEIDRYEYLKGQFPYRIVSIAGGLLLKCARQTGSIGAFMDLIKHIAESDIFKEIELVDLVKFNLKSKLKFLLIKQHFFRLYYVMLKVLR